MSTKHTPEPWSAAVSSMRGIIDRSCNVIAEAIPTVGSEPTAEMTANRRRIVECVNAMAGVEFPECAMERVRGTLQNLLALCESQGLKGGAGLARECLDEIGRIREKATP